MRTQGRAWAWAPALVIPLVLVTASLGAQQKDAKKYDKAQQQEALALSKLIDSAQTGEAAAADVPMSLDRYDCFRAASGKTYVPFAVDVDATTLAGPSVSVLLRVVKRGAQPPAKPAQPASSEETPANAQAQAQASYTYQDVYFFDLRPPQQTAAAASPATTAAAPSESGAAAPAQSKARQFARAFQAEPGEYDVYIALKERNPIDKKKPHIGLLKQSVLVADFGSGELTTSTVIVTDRIDPLSTPLTADQQRENPYAVGGNQFYLKAGTKFAKTEELTVYFQIYNAQLDTAKKPDVLIEYGFFQKKGDAEKRVFNSDPQLWNGTTLPPQFDGTVHALVGGSGWGLAKFPDGDYRLEIKVTDKRTGKSLTRNVSFSVAAT